MASLTSLSRRDARIADTIITAAGIIIVWVVVYEITLYMVDLYRCLAVECGR